jgi:hypothetical protein
MHPRLARRRETLDFVHTSVKYGILVPIRSDPPVSPSHEPIVHTIQSPRGVVCRSEVSVSSAWFDVISSVSCMLTFHQCRPRSV